MSDVLVGQSQTDRTAMAAYAPVHSGINSAARAVFAVAVIGLLCESMPCDAQSVGLAPQPQGAPATPAQAEAVTQENRAVHPYDWTGFYVGGHFGYGRGQAGNTLFEPAAQGSDNWFGSLYGGFQAGYDYMFPSRLVLGFEADVSFPNFLEDGVASTRATAQSTVTSSPRSSWSPSRSSRSRWGYSGRWAR